jgi:dTDP-4-dehydrorhamnose 3,5-epimerase
MKIIGFKEINKKIIKVKKGDILKYLSKKDKFFSGFGEVYFSEIKKNKTKGWNLHKKNTCILSVPFGSVVFNFIDGRINKKTHKNVKKVVLSKKNFKIIVVPPGVWFSFKSLTHISIVANCINKVHSDQETLKSDKVNNIKIK